MIRIGLGGLLWICKRFVIAEGLYLGKHLGKDVVSFNGMDFGASIVIRLEDIAPGEHSEFLLMDAKENILNTVTYLPYPLEVVAEDGAKLSMSYCGDCLYTYEVKNLKPNEKITVVSTSGPEKGEYLLTADTKGAFMGSISPKVIRMDISKCNFTVKRELHSLSLDYICSSLPVSLKADTPVVFFTMDHSPSTEDLTEVKYALERSLK